MSRQLFPRLAGIIRMAGWALVATLAIASSSCAAVFIGAAGGSAGAVYVMGKLTEELGYDVPAVHGATLAAMKELGLKASEDRADKLTAHLESEFADGAHLWIDLDSIGDARTRLAIRVGLTGDEHRSRKILEIIKRHLSRPGGAT